MKNSFCVYNLLGLNYRWYIHIIQSKAHNKNSWYKEPFHQIEYIFVIYILRLADTHY